MNPLLAATLAVLVLGVASAAQAVTGFGLALVAVPLLSLVFGPVPAVLATTVVGMVLTAQASVRERAHVDGRVARRLVLTGLLGVPVGYLVLTTVPGRPLQVVIAVVLLLLVAVLASGLRLSSGPWSQRVAGVASGVLLSATGMNGPPLVVVLSALRLSPRRFRATLQAVFCVQDTAAVALFLVTGTLGPEVWAVAGAGILGVPLGWWLGDRLFGVLPPERFRQVVLGGLAALAVTSVVSAIVG